MRSCLYLYTSVCTHVYVYLYVESGCAHICSTNVKKPFVYTCIFRCIYIYVYSRTCVYPLINRYMWACGCMCAYLTILLVQHTRAQAWGIYICLVACLCVCACVYVRVCIDVGRLHEHTARRMYVCTYVCMHVCVCECACVRVWCTPV